MKPLIFGRRGEIEKINLRSDIAKLMGEGLGLAGYMTVKILPHRLFAGTKDEQG
jgi:hypothetical protein